MTTTAESIEAVARELGLSMTAEFVPLSQSRNKGEKSPSLNWKVTLLRNGRPIITTDYTAGCGHCPGHANKQNLGNYELRQLIAAECESGFARWYMVNSDYIGYRTPRKPILPSLADVLHSLASDSDVLDAGGFEEWAGNLGYDTDSRKAEGIYRACLEIALKLRAALGDEGFATLRSAVQDY